MNPLIVVALVQALAGPASEVSYDREVRPLLARNCFSCHGPDPSTREAELRLDTFEGATELRDGVAAIVPSEPEASELWLRIHDARHPMPPPESGHRLTADDKRLLERWIRSGANYAPHWSFVPVERPAVPALLADAGLRPIDAFVLDGLQGTGLSPAAPADRYTLARRLALDLTGLPADPALLAAFVGDQRPDAYGRYVDQLLTSRHYGEHWAAMWLDLARYADSKGYGSDPLRTIWRWRDWVIEAFDSNMPFDRFTELQMAGDLLPDASLETRLATAFHRNTMVNTEGGTDDEEYRVAAVKDRVNTTAQTWLGLTIACAQCHTHKFDPISHREYYSFFDLFNQTTDRDANDDSPRIETPTQQENERRAELKSQLARIDSDIASFVEAHSAAMGVWMHRQWSWFAAEQKRRVQDLLDTLEITETPVLVALPPSQQRETHILLKGNFLTPGERVSPGVPAFLAGPKPVTNRLELAHWLTSRQNPLTARVYVNRLWARLFGRGLVETEEDFGAQGDQPSHPELLDWLAAEFMESGWDQRHILRTIVSSDTYRRDSTVTSQQLAADPDNRLLARGPRFRLSAEQIRDQALALSGLLSHEKFGPSVFPPQPEGLWQAAFNGTDRTWETSRGPDRYRRALYVFLRRSSPYPSLQIFDAPTRESCTPRRIRTNTPLQAFVTLNDPVFVECAQALARRLLLADVQEEAQRAALGLERVLQRPPSSEETATLVDLLRSERAHFLSHPAQALECATQPLGPLPEGQDPVEAAAWTVVSNVLLNLDGVLTKN